jgi:hypothetical protein
MTPPSGLLWGCTLAKKRNSERVIDGVGTLPGSYNTWHFGFWCPFFAEKVVPIHAHHRRTTHVGPHPATCCCHCYCFLPETLTCYCSILSPARTLPRVPLSLPRCTKYTPIHFAPWRASAMHGLHT